MILDTLPSLSINFQNQLGFHLPKLTWSKWEKGRYGLLKEELDEWYCQVCAEKQTKLLPSYMFSLDDGNRDFARVCTSCKSKAGIKHITTYWELVRIIKG